MVEENVESLISNLTLDYVEHYITIQNKYFDLIDCNEAVLKHFKMRKEELMGKYVKEYDLWDANSPFVYLVDTINKKTSHTEKIRIKDRIYQGSASPLFDEKKNIIGVMQILTDITSQEKKEINIQANLKAYYEDLEYILKHTKYIFCEVSVKKEENTFLFPIEYANNMFYKHFNLKEHEVVGKNIYDIYHPDVAKMYCKIGRELYYNKEEEGKIFYIKRQDEKRLILFEEEIIVEEGWDYWEIKMYPLIKNNEVKKIIIKSKNITTKLRQLQRERINNAMKIYHAKLERILDVISNLSHTWRQPLNSLNFCVLNFIDEIRTGCDTKEILEEYYEEIREIMDMLSQKIDKFQFFFELSHERQFFEIDPYIDLALEIMEEKIKKEHIKIISKRNDGLRIYGSANVFGHMLYYLLYDVIGYCKKNFDLEERTVYIEKKLEENKVNLKIYVLISEKNKPKVEPVDRRYYNVLLLKNIVEEKMKGSVSIIDSDFEKGVILGLPVQL